MKLSRMGLIVLIVGASSLAHAGGSAEVLFPGSARYSDAGTWGPDREANLRLLASHLKVLASRHLAAGQQLTVEILDVDLAGSFRPWRATGSDIRVLRGTADWPRIDLRYTLVAEGQASTSGKESISDLNYLQRFGGNRTTEPLAHEKRMLGDWFQARFVEARSAH